MTKKITAIGAKILGEMIDGYGTLKKTAGGIILKDDDATEQSIRPRWFKIYSVGPDVDFVKKGDFVMVDHGRWSNAMKISEELKLYLVDNKDCLATTDKDPTLDNSIVIGQREIRKRPSDDTSRQIRQNM